MNIKTSELEPYHEIYNKVFFVWLISNDQKIHLNKIFNKTVPKQMINELNNQYGCVLDKTSNIIDHSTYSTGFKSINNQLI